MLLTVSRRKAFTMIEVLIVIGILALAIMPIYQAIIGSRITSSKAELSYIAVQLTREKMEEMMSVPYDQLKSEGYTKVKGPVVSEALLKMTARSGQTGPTQSLTGSVNSGFSGGARVGTAAGKAVIDSGSVAGEGEYPVEYMRFERMVTVTPKGNRLKQITVQVRWYEKGSKDLKENNYLYNLSTLVANHSLSAYSGAGQ